MYLAGEWAFYADKCLDGKKYKKFLNDLSKLSWLITNVYVWKK